MKKAAMKKVMGWLLALCMVLGFAACSTNEPETTQPEQTTQAVQTTQEVQTQEAAQLAVLYLPNEDVSGFVTKEEPTDGTAAGIVEKLVQEGALPEGCALLSFEDGTADMNEAFGNAVKNTGSSEEYTKIGSVVNTLLTFYELEQIVLTVEGETLETGHNVYDDPLAFFEAQTEDPAREQPVTLYLPNGNADGFITKEAVTDGSAMDIVEKLVAAGALPKGCALLSFAGGAADMNEVFVKDAGSSEEGLRIGSVVNTLLKFYDMEQITITVEGKTMETGHNTYDEPFDFFELPTAVAD